MSNESTNLSKIYWLWLPLAVLGVVLALDLVLPYEKALRMYTENGPIETIQVVVLALAFLTALKGLMKPEIRKDKLLLAWFGIALLGCVYVLGEEISWGQHWLGWDTPEGWKAVNDQQETNIHNTSSWFDQKPRLLLEIGTVVGGLVLPFVVGMKTVKLPQWILKLCPTKTLAVTAGVFVFVKISDKIDEVIGYYIFQRPSELAELAVYYFILLYLVTLVRQRELS